MLSFHKVFILPVILLLLYICTIQGDLRAAQTSYAPQILQHVSEDKVYLLENIRKNITIPSEKLVVDALFSEDGLRPPTSTGNSLPSTRIRLSMNSADQDSPHTSTH